MRGLVRVALIASLSGCSFIAAHPPPATPEAGAPRCNPGKGAVGVDGVVAGIAGIVALASASNNSGAALGSGLVGATYFGSALYGNWSANQCRKALAQRAETPPPPVVEEEDPVKEVAKVEAPKVVAPVAQPVAQPVEAQKQPTTTTTTTTTTSTSTSTTPDSDDPWSDFWTEAQ